MPYLNCPGCELTIYSAAAYSTSDHCPRCGTALDRVARPPRLMPPDEGPASEPDRGPEPAEAAPQTVGDLKVRVRRAAHRVHVVVTGDLVYPDAAVLDSTLEQIEAGDRQLLIDLRRITSLDSTGLSSLLGAYIRAKRDDVDLAVVSPPPEFRRILELTGVDQWLALVEDSRDHATGAS